MLQSSRSPFRGLSLGLSRCLFLGFGIGIDVICATLVLALVSTSARCRLTCLADGRLMASLKGSAALSKVLPARIFRRAARSGSRPNSKRMKSRKSPAAGRLPRWTMLVSKRMSVPARPLRQCGTYASAASCASQTLGIADH